MLDKIASSEIVDAEWTLLRDVLKYKISENLRIFLNEKPGAPPLTFSPQHLATGGLRLPPFPSGKHARSSRNAIPASYMTEEQARELKGQIFTQLDGFDSGPPFTIQRVCELCLHPKKHYSTVGKYLRAVEKSLLVTSTLDDFPPFSAIELNSSGRSVFSLGSTRQSAPSTPLFSPIPFLHEDARRSKSRSPPPSPLILGSAEPITSRPLEPKALGLIDELDDPSPGHLSDHPIQLTSVASSIETPRRPLLGSLEQRFVKSDKNATTNTESEISTLDEDKENNKT